MKTFAFISAMLTTWASLGFHLYGSERTALGMLISAMFFTIALATKHEGKKEEKCTEQYLKS